MGWLPFALKKGKEIIAQQNIDIILSTYNPSLPHLIASKLSKQSGIPWVADLEIFGLIIRILKNATISAFRRTLGKEGHQK